MPMRSCRRLAHEVLNHMQQRLAPRDAFAGEMKILLGHRTAVVQREHDVDALGRVRQITTRHARSGQRNDEQSQAPAAALPNASVRRDAAVWCRARAPDCSEGSVMEGNGPALPQAATPARARNSSLRCSASRGKGGAQSGQANSKAFARRTLCGPIRDTADSCATGPPASPSSGRNAPAHELFRAINRRERLFRRGAGAGKFQLVEELQELAELSDCASSDSTPARPARLRETRAWSGSEWAAQSGLRCKCAECPSSRWPRRRHRAWRGGHAVREATQGFKMRRRAGRNRTARLARAADDSSTSARRNIPATASASTPRR